MPMSTSPVPAQSLLTHTGQAPFQLCHLALDAKLEKPLPGTLWAWLVQHHDAMGAWCHSLATSGATSTNARCRLRITSHPALQLAFPRVVTRHEEKGGALPLAQYYLLVSLLRNGVTVTGNQQAEELNGRTPFAAVGPNGEHGYARW
jgi:hypothetical protein